MITKRAAIGSLLGLGLALGSLAAQDVRPYPDGRYPHPLFDRAGNFVLVYQNSANGLNLATPGEKNSIEEIAPAAGAFEPAVRKNKAGEIGIVWVQASPGKNEIYFGFFQDGRIRLARPIARSESPLISPDLDFDQESNPWITWVECAGPKYCVRVASLGQAKTWTVNEPFCSSALTPKILAGGSRGTWVFWTGRDRGRDEIFGSVFRGSAWENPFRLNKDVRYPHTSPAAGLDGSQNPWVVWSAYDGRSYNICVSSWNGEGWTAEEKITDNEASNTSPAIAFVSETIPLVIWSRTSGRTSRLCASYKLGPVWSPEIGVISDQAEPIRTPRIAALGDRLGLAWESGGQIESLVLSFSALGRGLPSPALPQDSPPIINPSLDENQYTGFGDSITYAENQGYLPRLEPMLIQKYGAGKIWNEGEGGETTLEGLVRIDAAIAAHQSRYLLLMEGTNDVIFLDISMDTASFDLQEMIKKCLRAGLLPLIATIIPRDDWYWSVAPYQSRIADLNGKIRQFTGALKIPMVDQYEAFINYPAIDGGWTSLMLSDGVHPNPKGFQFMAETWFGGIQILPFPPVDVQLSRSNQRILFYSRTGVLIHWQNNPKNAIDQIIAFRIYRKERDADDVSFQLVAEAPFLEIPLTHKYFDVNISLSKRYAYILSTIRKDGVEGPVCGTVWEIF
jgi:lysophospholipase L1-like esterase